MTSFADLARAREVDRVAALCALAAEVAPVTVPDAGTAEVEEALGALAATVRTGPGADDAAQAEALRVALGVQAGFSGFADDHADVRSSLLPEVVRRGRGLPVLLGVVWAEVARRAGIDAAPLGTPGHVVVAVGDVLVDPFAGGRVVDVETLRARAASFGQRWGDDALDPMDDATLLLRVLANLQDLGVRTSDLMLRARAATLALAVPGRPLQSALVAADALTDAGAFDLAGRVWDDVAAEVVSSGPDDAVPDGLLEAARAARLRGRAVRARLS